MPVNPHLIVCNYVQWNAGSQACLNALAHIDMFLLLLTQEVGHKFGSRIMRLQIVFQNALNGPRYSWHCSHFTVTVCIFICFPHQRISRVSGIFSVGHMCFELEKALKNLCCSCYLLSRSFIQHFISFCSIFPSLKQNLVQAHCSFNSAIF